MITDLPTKCYHSSIHFSEFYLQDSGKNHLAHIWNKITSLSPYVYNSKLKCAENYNK